MSMHAFEPLSQLIDDYILWFAAWHRFAMAEGDARQDVLKFIDAPVNFKAWQTSAAKTYPQAQPAIERIVEVQEQLHTLARMVMIKTSEPGRIGAEEDAGVVVKCQELIQGLRRLERAFAAAASGLDVLTGLRTRKGLLNDIEREVSRFKRTNRPFCIVIADIDHFKKINDSYGHDVGDRVLASVADHISRSLRAHDDAYRLGGEEFLLCLKEADAAAGHIVVERLRKIREKPIAGPTGEKIAVTLSFGLAVSVSGITADELIKRADKALYRAKQEGRDRVIIATV
jgi:diguanylate cyclase